MCLGATTMTTQPVYRAVVVKLPSGKGSFLTKSSPPCGPIYGFDESSTGCHASDPRRHCSGTWHTRLPASEGGTSRAYRRESRPSLRGRPLEPRFPSRVALAVSWLHRGMRPSSSARASRFTPGPMNSTASRLRAWPRQVGELRDADAGTSGVGDTGGKVLLVPRYRERSFCRNRGHGLSDRPALVRRVPNALNLYYLNIYRSSAFRREEPPRTSSSTPSPPSS